MYTVVLAHVAFSIAYVVIVVSARLRTVSPALEEAAMDLGANEWQAFWYVTLPALVPGNRGRGAARAHRFVRRLRDHQHGGGRGLGNPAHGDLRHGAPRREPGDQRDLGADHGGLRRADPDFGTGAGGMNRRTFFLGHGRASPGARAIARPRLNVYNWSAYIAPETIPAFEAEFGVRVRYATYESNEEMLAKVLSGNSGWDVVFPTHNRLQPMRENGLLAPLRHEWLPGLAQPGRRGSARPPGTRALEWGVPYMWNGTGIVYQPQAAARRPRAGPTCGSRA